MPGLEAVVGYAVGTFQVLAIDWWRRIALHRRQLRLLQAELRRMNTFAGKFRWVGGLPPEDEQLAVAPSPTDLFIRTVGEIEWRLTDEHRDDNSQQFFLQLLDGCKMLKHYADKVYEVADQAGRADSAEKARLRNRGARYADAYDARIDEILYLIDNGLRDLLRRLDETTLGAQMSRALEDLPTGKNPAALQPNDPRIEEWKRKRSRPAS